jgi:hypothetical protein
LTGLGVSVDREIEVGVGSGVSLATAVSVGAGVSLGSGVSVGVELEVGSWLGVSVSVGSGVSVGLGGASVDAGRGGSDVEEGSNVLQANAIETINANPNSGATTVLFFIAFLVSVTVLWSHYNPSRDVLQLLRRLGQPVTELGMGHIDQLLRPLADTFPIKRSYSKFCHDIVNVIAGGHNPGAGLQRRHKPA